MQSNLILILKIFQSCTACGDSVSSRLENISSQLSSLTRVVLGLGQDDNVSDHDHDDTLGYGHDDTLGEDTDSDAELRHLFREKSVMRELSDEDFDQSSQRGNNLYRLPCFISHFEDIFRNDGGCNNLDNL